jgi:hypothetical protein
MKDDARSISRLVSVPALTFMLICSFAYFAPGELRAVSAQNTSPSGSFGFLINIQASFPANDRGFVILGVMNFDGAGNVTGPYTAHISASSNGKPAGSLTGTFTGTYVSNPDGTGSVTIALDAGLSFTFATVITDGGQSIQMVFTGGAGGNFGGDGASGVARSGQTGSPKGSYGFRLNNSPFPGGTIGVMNFDGAGSVSVSLITAGIPEDNGQPPVASGTLTGTYSINPDGSGTVDLAAASGQTVNSSFAMVITDGGSGILLLQTTGNPTANGTPEDNASFGTAHLQ